MKKLTEENKTAILDDNTADPKNQQMLFDNLIWLTTKEAATYLRRSVNAIRILVCRRKLRARKFGGKLYFKKVELDELLESSQLTGGYSW